MKYTFHDLKKDFPNDDICLDFIFKRKYRHLEINKYKPVKNRRSYFNTTTSRQVYPTANTILHKTRTPLTSWFYAIYIFSQSKNGVSAKELQRQIGVSYKTAWLIGHKIRKLMKQDNVKLKGIIELDETYYGGKEKNKHKDKRVKNSQGRSIAKKVPIFGLLQRKGKLVAVALDDVKKKTLKKHINRHIKKKSRVMTDEYNGYEDLEKDGFDHETVNHAAKEYVRDDIYTNNIEGFWSQFKRSIDGTHHVISKKWLQLYLNEFVFKYNNRKSEYHLFLILLDKIFVVK